jgi:hypothetical protein
MFMAFTKMHYADELGLKLDNVLQQGQHLFIDILIKFVLVDVYNLVYSIKNCSF